jgi:enoyl-CoA hydratase/carnithine racemase/predicted thioesterase
MKSGLAVGATAELNWRVSAEHVIHLGVPAPDLQAGFAEKPTAGGPTAVVFSTPNMILLMERAARKLLAPYLEPGEESVGVRVEVDHLAGTPLGAPVRGEARVTSIDGRLVDFEIAAFDRLEKIGSGKHRRAIVDLQRVKQKLAKKELGPGVPAAAEAPPTTEAPTTEAPTAPPVLETIELSLQPPVAWVTLNRPHKKNAVNRQMTADWESINQFLAQRPDLRVVVIRGAGGAFCAGDDVPEVGSLEPAEAQELSYRQARLYLAWEQLPQVFVAAVEGEAYGAGCVAACACDLRIASYTAKFGMPEILLGWPPGYGVAQLTALVGKSRALEMCLLGEPIKARRAEEWGLVHQVTSGGDLMRAAGTMAEKLAALPKHALRETKQLVHLDEGLQPKTAYLADTAAYIRCLQQPDAREGIAAFREKRPPRFRS